MYKSRLQELCQQRLWTLPDYASIRDGPDHTPRFTATVTINGERFQTQNPCKSSKEAQNDAARVAFFHFTNPKPPPPQPSVPSSFSHFPQPSLPSSSGKNSMEIWYLMFMLLVMVFFFLVVSGGSIKFGYSWFYKFAC